MIIPIGRKHLFDKVIKKSVKKKIIIEKQLIELMK